MKYHTHRTPKNYTQPVEKPMTVKGRRATTHFIYISVLLLSIIYCCPISAAPLPIEKLSAKLIFQRPDGIYVQTVGATTAQRVVAGGSRPRWAPDGQKIAYLQGNAIMLYSLRKARSTQLATAAQPRALCFSSNGNAVFFTDGKLLRRVDIRTKMVTTLYQGLALLELDAVDKDRRIAGTVKTFTGFRVVLLDLTTGVHRTVARGCSASLSPSGDRVTVNGPRHRRLSFYRWQDIQKVGGITAPGNTRFDNQQWSNHPLWLTSTSEGKQKDIYLHHVATDSAYRITSSGDCDRADLYVIQTKN